MKRGPRETPELAPPVGERSQRGSYRSFRPDSQSYARCAGYYTIALSAKNASRLARARAAQSLGLDSMRCLERSLATRLGSYLGSEIIVFAFDALASVEAHEAADLDRRAELRGAFSHGLGDRLIVVNDEGLLEKH